MFWENNKMTQETKDATKHYNATHAGTTNSSDWTCSHCNYRNDYDREYCLGCGRSW